MIVMEGQEDGRILREASIADGHACSVADELGARDNILACLPLIGRRTAGGRMEGLREEQMRGLKATLDQTGKGQIWVRREEGASQMSAT